MPASIQQDVSLSPVPGIYRPASGTRAITLPCKLPEDSGHWFRGETPYREGCFMLLDEQLQRLATVERNWDSYGADAPNEAALVSARDILKILEFAAFPPTRIVPSAEGGAGICFVEGENYADIECLNTGEILAAMYCGQAEPTVWEVGGGEQSIRSTIEKIRVHITA